MHTFSLQRFVLSTSLIDHENTTSIKLSLLVLSDLLTEVVMISSMSKALSFSKILSCQINLQYDCYLLTQTNIMQ